VIRSKQKSLTSAEPSVGKIEPKQKEMLWDGLTFQEVTCRRQSTGVAKPLYDSEDFGENSILFYTESRTRRVLFIFAAKQAKMRIHIPALFARI